jgi:hypothetical protein
MVDPAVITEWPETDCTGSKVSPLAKTDGCQPLARELALVQGYIHVNAAVFLKPFDDAPEYQARWCIVVPLCGVDICVGKGCVHVILFTYLHFSLCCEYKHLTDIRNE